MKMMIIGLVTILINCAFASTNVVDATMDVANVAAEQQYRFFDWFLINTNMPKTQISLQMTREAKQLKEIQPKEILGYIATNRIIRDVVIHAATSGKTPKIRAKRGLIGVGYMCAYAVWKWFYGRDSSNVRDCIYDEIEKSNPIEDYEKRYRRRLISKQEERKKIEKLFREIEDQVWQCWIEGGLDEVQCILGRCFRESEGITQDKTEALQ